MSVTINRDEWLKALTDAGVTMENDPDALTVAEFQEMFGLTRSTSERHLRKLVAEGKAIETKKLMRTANNRRTVAHIAFRLLTEPPKKGRKH